MELYRAEVQRWTPPVTAGLGAERRLLRGSE
jgi:RES domain-containing protein